MVHCCKFIVANSNSKIQRMTDLENPDKTDKRETKSGIFFNEYSRKCAKSILKAIQYC